MWDYRRQAIGVARSRIGRCEALDQAAMDLMRLGADAEVLEPLELRRRIAEIAYDLLRLYRGPP